MFNNSTAIIHSGRATFFFHSVWIFFSALFKPNHRPTTRLGMCVAALAGFGLSETINRVEKKAPHNVIKSRILTVLGKCVKE